MVSAANHWELWEIPVSIWQELRMRNIFWSQPDPNDTLDMAVKIERACQEVHCYL